MRSVNSKNIDGSQAIIIAAFRVWAGHPSSREFILSWLREQPIDVFNVVDDQGRPIARTEMGLGRVFYKLHPDSLRRPWKAITSQPGVCEMVKMAIDEWDAMTRKKQEEAKRSLRHGVRIRSRRLLRRRDHQGI